MKKAMIALATLSFFHFEDVKCSMFGFFGDARELPADSEIIQTRAGKSNFLKTSDFDSIYKNLPETGATVRDFAFFTANPESQKMFQSHFERIKLVNCRDLYANESSDQPKCVPELFVTELYSGSAALKLAQS